MQLHIPDFQRIVGSGHYVVGYMDRQLQTIAGSGCRIRLNYRTHNGHITESRPYAILYSTPVLH